jgi:gluconokinase
MSVPMVQSIVICGPAGSGKTTLAKAWIESHPDWKFIEGDELHPPANIEKMSSGIPLDDDDRGPWYELIAAEINKNLAASASVIVTCSALKKLYRDWLRVRVPGIRFVFLSLEEESARERVERRQGHYMKASMVASQYKALELPGRDEALLLNASQSPENLLLELGAYVAAHGR